MFSQSFPGIDKQELVLLLVCDEGTNLWLHKNFNHWPSKNRSTFVLALVIMSRKNIKKAISV